jgi:hypothetical protein
MKNGRISKSEKKMKTLREHFSSIENFKLKMKN